MPIEAIAHNIIPETAERLGEYGSLYLEWVRLAREMHGKPGPWIDGGSGVWRRVAFNAAATRVEVVAAVHPSDAGVSVWLVGSAGTGFAADADTAKARADEVLALVGPFWAQK